MSKMEYIKLLWRHHYDDEPIVILYEVDLENERLAASSIEIFSDGKTKNITDFYKDVIEIVPIPTIDEINFGEYGEEFFACLMNEEDYRKVWKTHIYQETLSV